MCRAARSAGLAAANAFGSNQRIINHARNVAFGETHVFSPSMVNQASFGYNRIFDYIASQGTGTCASANLVPGGIPGANLGCPSRHLPSRRLQLRTGFHRSSPAAIGRIGDRGYSPFQGGTNIYSFKDSLDLILGKHDLHTGHRLSRQSNERGHRGLPGRLLDRRQRGNFTGFTSANVGGNPEADFLLGITGLAIHDQTFDGSVTGRRWKIYRPFIEDDWRVTPALTLNLGLAWDLTTPITEAHGRMANYVPATGQLLIANQNGVSASAGVNMDLTALEPRVGATWKVFGSEKTVLRAGYALFHDSAWSQGAQGLWQNPPFLGESDDFPASPRPAHLCNLLLRHRARAAPLVTRAHCLPSGLSRLIALPRRTAANFHRLRSTPSPPTSNSAGSSNTTSTSSANWSATWF